jgi:hypothetical protein
LIPIVGADTLLSETQRARTVTAGRFYDKTTRSI